MASLYSLNALSTLLSLNSSFASSFIFLALSNYSKGLVRFLIRNKFTLYSGLTSSTILVC
jgi:hypothetical protein